MQAELLVLALAALLLLVNTLLAGHFKTKQYGVAWNMGPRDGQQPPLDPVAGRLERARANLMETLPIAIIALFGVVLAGRTSPVTEIAAWTWLGARVVYLPLLLGGCADDPLPRLADRPRGPAHRVVAIAGGVGRGSLLRKGLHPDISGADIAAGR